jgi:hypothetical protein
MKLFTQPRNSIKQSNLPYQLLKKNLSLKTMADNQLVYQDKHPKGEDIEDTEEQEDNYSDQDDFRLATGPFTSTQRGRSGPKAGKSRRQKPTKPTSPISLSTPAPTKSEDETFLTKKKKLRPAEAIFHQIAWDPELPKEGCIIGYLDRFIGIREVPYQNFLRVFEDDFDRNRKSRRKTPQLENKRKSEKKPKFSFRLGEKCEKVCVIVIFVHSPLFHNSRKRMRRTARRGGGESETIGQNRSKKRWFLSVLLWISLEFEVEAEYISHGIVRPTNFEHVFRTKHPFISFSKHCLIFFCL